MIDSKQDEAVKLEACPFCHGPTMLFQDPGDDGPDVRCAHCGARGPSPAWEDFESDGEAVTEAKRLWNTRTGLANV